MVVRAVLHSRQYAVCTVSINHTVMMHQPLPLHATTHISKPGSARLRCYCESSARDHSTPWTVSNPRNTQPFSIVSPLCQHVVSMNQPTNRPAVKTGAGHSQATVLERFKNDMKSSLEPADLHHCFHCLYLSLPITLTLSPSPRSTPSSLNNSPTHTNLFIHWRTGTCTWT